MYLCTKKTWLTTINECNPDMNALPLCSVLVLVCFLSISILALGWFNMMFLNISVKQWYENETIVNPDSSYMTATSCGGHISD